MSTAKVGGLVELLPCPFCGGGAEFVAFKDNGLTIRCKTFGCVRRDQRAFRLSMDQLREAMAKNWNTRALSAHGQPVVDEAECACASCRAIKQLESVYPYPSLGHRVLATIRHKAAALAGEAHD